MLTSPCYKAFRSVFLQKILGPTSYQLYPVNYFQNHRKDDLQDTNGIVFIICNTNKKRM